VGAPGEGGGGGGGQGGGCGVWEARGLRRDGSQFEAKGRRGSWGKSRGGGGGGGDGGGPGGSGGGLLG